MKHILHGCLALLFAFAFLLPTARAEESVDPASPATETAKSAAQDTTAGAEDDWYYTKVEDPAAIAQREKEKAEKEEKRKKAKLEERYTLLLSDSGYDYYLDHRATRWSQLPHGSEQILDTWVKLVPQKTSDEEAADGSYTYPQKYYLAHYYIRPKTQQIQFLSELEVTGGRPDNTVQGRGYNAQNWEDLTPDSIEDEIYHNALTQFKNRKNKKNPLHMLTDLTGENGPKNLRDAIEEYFRISF